MRLFLFDFDMTLTFLQTDTPIYRAEEKKHVTPEARKDFIRNNMKPGIAELFRHILAAGDVVSIPTFCNDPKLVYEHLRATGLTEKELSKIIIEFRPENFDQFDTQKDAQVERIVKRAEQATGQPVTEAVFADDSGKNLQNIEALMARLAIRCKTILVPTKTFRDEKGVPVDPRSDFIDELFYNYFKPLFDAMQLGVAERIICNLINPENASARDLTGAFTLLHYAVKFGLSKVVEKLVRSGAQLDAKNDCGRTALHEAVQRGNQVIAALLLNAGANPNETDKAGDTPLHLAVEKEDSAMAALLLEKGANAQVANLYEKKTPVDLVSASFASFWVSAHTNAVRKIMQSNVMTDSCKLGF